MLSKSIFYNTTIFNVYFALILFVAGMRFAEEFTESKQILPKVIAVGIFHQYFILPLFAILFAFVFQTSLEVTLAIFLSVSFPNNRFSLILSWVAGGSALYSVISALLAIIISLTLTPIIFYVLMHSNSETINVVYDYSYLEFISILYGNRVEFFLTIVPAVVLGYITRKVYNRLPDLIETKVYWLGLFFVFLFVIIIYNQRPEYFNNNWHFFAWQFLLYHLSIYGLSMLVARLFALPYKFERSLVYSSAKSFIFATFIVLFTWYPNMPRTLWLLSVQTPLFHWSLLGFAFYTRYQIEKENKLRQSD